jgi:hypothetical protein
MAAASVPCGSAHLPNRDDYLGDIRRASLHCGAPTQQSISSPLRRFLYRWFEDLASKPLPEQLVLECLVSGAQLRGAVNAPRRAVAWLLDKKVFKPVPRSASLLRLYCVGAIILCKLREAFGSSGVAEQWLRSYCPTCGSAPAMSQLVGTDPGPCASFLAMLRHTLAIPANRMPVLRKRRRPSSLRSGGRGREIPSYRLLPVLLGLSQNL